MAYDSAADRVILFGGVGYVGPSPVDLNETWAYDYNTNTWERRLTPNTPPARHAHRMAYDENSGVTVMVSGHAGAGSPRWADAWVYNYAANTWTDVTPAPGLGPLPSSYYSMAYDVQSDLVVHFSGEGAAGMGDATWTYDFDSGTWTNANSLPKPPGRWMGYAAYDAKSDRTVHFGGSAFVVGAGTGTTLVLDVEGNTWTQTNPATRPSPRIGHVMAYDVESDRIVLFGGCRAISDVCYGDTWAYDTDAKEWFRIDVAVHPASRAYHSIAYDSGSDRTLLFGGIIELGQTADTYEGATWKYDLNTNAWVQTNPSPQPPPMISYSMAYDAGSDRVILFGGCTSCFPSPWVPNLDTWAYDTRAGGWTMMPVVPHPPGMIGGRMVYDAGSDRIVLFGGYLLPSGPLSSETWAYDFDTNSWTDMAPSTRPPERNYYGMAYDSESDLIILFGGSSSVAAHGDTWAYDLDTNTWTDLQPTAAPSARNYHWMDYDVQSDRVIMFGGRPTEDETWAYDVNTNTWTNMNPPAPPPGRSRHGMAYDNESDRIVLFGGWKPPYPIQTDSLLSDTWSYDLEANAWIPRIVTPSEPLGLAATPTGSRVDLTWSAPSSEGSHPVTSYRVYRAVAGEALALIAEVGPILAYADTNATEGRSYLYEVAAVNAAGEGARSNRASATVPDVTNPTISISSPAAGALLASRLVVVTGTAADNVALDKVELSSDGTTWVPAAGTTSWSGQVTLPEGPNALRARATDLAGNQREATVAIVVDVTAPSVAITSTNFPIGTATISGTAADNVAVARVEVSTDNRTWLPATGTTSWSVTLTLPAESFTLNARATDAAGNLVVARVFVDRPPPPPVNVLLLAGIAGTVAAVAAIVAVLLWRRRKG